MVYFKLFFIFLFFFLQPSRSYGRCSYGCGTVPILFPFQMINSPPENRCGLPGFTVVCQNETQNILQFPYSGDFRISDVDYFSQIIHINDPSNCTAKRLLQGFDYSSTPFRPLHTRNFTFLNCSSDAPNLLHAGVSPIPCLSSESFSVVALPTETYSLSDISSCWEIATILYPTSMPGYLSNSIEDHITLKWKTPNRIWREWNGKDDNCGYYTSSDLGSSEPSDYGFSSILFYVFIALFVLASGVLIFGVAVCSLKMIDNDSLDTSLLGKGLARPTIEMYPTTLLDEGLELPNPNDNTCSICLLEYQAKDMLRTIPSCLHYFHVGCIDEWLKLNGTCPLCRNI